MKQRDEILDLLRGASALLVMLGHLRGFLFVDYSELPTANLFSKLFYFGTGLGHQAVMVFFVLSGYFVGGSVLASLTKKRFSWASYTTARLSRLWTVLIPTLLLTLFIDSLTVRQSPASMDGLHAEIFCSGPSILNPAAHDPVTFLGNLFFLQTIEVPVYGTNSPLWSLANEFWYYILFPLLAFTSAAFLPNLRRSSSHFFQTALCVLLLIVLFVWLPTSILKYGLIWLLGVGVWCLANASQPKLDWQSTKWRIMFGMVFAASFIASKSSLWIGRDWMVGLTFSLWMLTLLGPWARLGWWSKTSAALSEISYTLYIVHFPVLFFIAATVFKGRQLQPNINSLTMFVVTALGVLAFSTVWWALFERNTATVRRWMAWK